MGYCEIDFCEQRNEKMLTVTTTDEVIRLGLCRNHATALSDRLAKQLGVDTRQVNLTNFGGTISELQEAIDYLDALAATQHGENPNDH